MFAAAGAIAEESLAAIRTVAAFGGELVEARRYASIYTQNKLSKKL